MITDCRNLIDHRIPTGRDITTGCVCQNVIIIFKCVERLYETKRKRAKKLFYVHFYK